MSEARGKPWTREEAVSVLALYCQIPFGKMHANNPAVHVVAKALGRSASSVALKLVNFASLDPEHQERGVKGMKNASRLDREVWDSYYGNWEALAMLGMPAIGPNEDVQWEAETESIATRRLRRGQSFFRRAVLSAYDHRCCITELSTSELLRASHIVPWAHDTSHRVDPRNGLAMNALHDAAFDRGLITLDDEYRVVLSKRLSGEMPRSVYDSFFEAYAGKRIAIPRRFVPRKEHLTYHREQVFQH